MLSDITKKSFLWSALSLAAAGGLVLGLNWVSPSTAQAATPPAPLANVSLLCGTEATSVQVFQDSVTATLGGETFEMPQVVTASGARYESGALSLWEHHGEWNLIRNFNQDNEVWTECATPVVTADLTCGANAVQVQAYGDYVVTNIANSQYTLPNVVSASGARYSDNQLTMWEHQGEWLLIQGENTAHEAIFECTSN